MNTKCLCSACKSPFTPSPSQVSRQRFCPNEACQRARRCRNQRLRRTQAQHNPVWPTSEAAAKPHEAALTQFHPAIIGLISLFIDSTSQEEIMVFMRRCAARGQDILFPPSSPEVTKRFNSQPNQQRRAVSKVKNA